MTNRTIALTILLGSTCLPSLLFAQPNQQGSSATFLEPEISTEASNAASPPLPVESKRIFGIFPNNRTAPTLKNHKRLSPKEKFAIARADSFDRGTLFLSAVFAANAQRTDAAPSFGQGVTGYAHYFGAAYGDAVIGNYMTEAIYPTLLHQDPRYFRRGIGSGWSRLGYAMGQIFWTHTDSDRTQFNYSEILGNSTAVAISEAYYPDNRNVSDAASRLGVQIGVDMVSNVLKEFWPDVNRMFSRKHRD